MATLFCIKNRRYSLTEKEIRGLTSGNGCLTAQFTVTSSCKITNNNWILFLFTLHCAPNVSVIEVVKWL